MTKKTVKLMIVVMMLLTVALYFISGTYARYTEEFTGEGSVAVAAWNVKVGDAEVENTFNLTLSQEDNAYVAKGKIAPDVTLKSGDIAINLDGTEVAVDVEAKIDTANEEYTKAMAKLGNSSKDLTIEAKVYKGDTGTTEEVEGGTIALPEGGKFSETDKYHIVVTATWADPGTGNDEEDTTAGKASHQETITIKVPVKVTLKQHLKSDVG